MKPRIIIKRLGKKAVFREFVGVNTNNFSKSTDAEIIEAGIEVLNQHPVDNLRPFARKIVRRRKNTKVDVEVIGAVLWAGLCGWKPKYLKAL